MSLVNWPNGKSCAITLTFDCDFETIYLGQDPTNIRRTGTLSQATYEAKVGLPKILQLLEDEGVPGTFFVPGWVADNRRSSIEAIAQAGHEIGHHSYSHRWIDPLEPAVELEEIDKGIESLKRLIGDDLVGYRAPFGEASPNILRLLAERGFLYDSSMMDDVVPYRHVLADGTPGVVELPWWRHVADAPYMVPPRPIFTNDHVLAIWKAEFDAAYAEAGFFDMLLHPQVIGRPGRAPLLREFIRYMQSHDNVWFANCRDVANGWLQQAPAFQPQQFTPFLHEDKDGRIVQS